ncbi:MAG: hypothetical protein QG644_500 [Patescibacteria group bacterium]|nr:hypothetical protein [Patescibacteria group bacterium]
MRKIKFIITIILGSIIGLLSWFLLKNSGDICPEINILNYINICSLLLYIFGIFPAMLVTYLVTFLIKKDIIFFWKKFSRNYLYIYIVLVIILPNICDSYLPLCKQTAFLYLIPIYFIIYIMLFVYQSIKSRNSFNSVNQE